MLVLSDGGQTFAAQPVLAAAERAHAAGLLIVPVCVENRLAACATMDAIASRADLAFRADATAELAPIFASIVASARDVVARQLEVTERLPDGLDYVVDSARPPADFDARSGQLRWRLGFVPRAGISLSYAVAPRWTGSFVLDGLEASLRDPLGRETRLPVATRSLDVVGTCGLETPTPSPSPSPTAIPSPTPLPSATPSPTREPRALYLPLLFAKQCLSRQRPADVVLLIDASNSMSDPTRAGRSKLEAVQEGASSFVARMRPEDRAAVIAFNNEAQLRIGLSADAAALQAAIEGIQPAPGTRIDVALYAAAVELAGPSRRPDSRGVILLMTDGQPAPETRAAALGAAEGARAAGHDIFVIGVGEGVDLDLLATLAGDPDHSFQADDAEAVAAIYREIGELIPCR
jgi:Mg-chelatase subunit ChlD